MGTTQSAGVLWMRAMVTQGLEVKRQRKEENGFKYDSTVLTCYQQQGS
jgi:hypothetical protein